MHSYKATTAQADVHLDLATAALRSELRHLITVDDTGELPDWSTLRIWGPFEIFDQHGEIRYEYCALVDCLSTADISAKAPLRPFRAPQAFRALAG